MYLAANGIFCDDSAEFPFQHLLKTYQFLAVKTYSGLCLAVWQLNDMNGLKLSQHLIHFLFAVAGCLAYNQVGEIKEGAFIRLGKAVAGFDEGTEVSGQILLSVRYGFVSYRAESHNRGAHGIGDFPGKIGAEDTDYRYAFLL